MRPSFLLYAGSAAATPLYITSIGSHQPVGLGTTNFWSFQMSIETASATSSAYCWRYWSDNCDPRNCGTYHGYSDNAPYGEWTRCFANYDEVLDNGANPEKATGEFSWRLSGEYYIGNFDVEIGWVGSGGKEW